MIARFAFNELVSFIAGWAICLDYLILIAICAFATTDYAAVFWEPLDSGVPEFLLAAALVAVRGVVERARLRARRATTARSCSCSATSRCSC